MRNEMNSNNKMAAPKRVEVWLENGKKFVAEVGAGDLYKEIYLGIEDEDGFWQDVAILGEAYEYGPGGYMAVKPGMYRLYVYGDADREDYTTAFNIAQAGIDVGYE